METKHVIIGCVVLVVLLALPLVLGKGDAPKPITLNQFDQIAPGLTYDQVVRLLGREGIPIQMTIEEAMELKDVHGRLLGNMGRQNFTVMGWKNTAGSARGSDPRIFVFFVNGAVVAKKHVGLT